LQKKTLQRDDVIGSRAQRTAVLPHSNRSLTGLSQLRNPSFHLRLCNQNQMMCESRR